MEREARAAMEHPAGWRRDRADERYERYWDGAAWTERVRPAEAPVRRARARVPDHVPELHRALASATNDIDAVEDLLSALFERTDAVRAPRAAARTSVTGSPPTARTAPTTRTVPPAPKATVEVGRPALGAPSVPVDDGDEWFDLEDVEPILDADPIEDQAVPGADGRDARFGGGRQPEHASEEEAAVFAELDAALAAEQSEESEVADVGR